MRGFGVFKREREGGTARVFRAREGLREEGSKGVSCGASLFGRRERELMREFKG